MVIKITRKKSIYEIPNCTLNQLIKYLRAVREVGINYEIKKSLVGDRDPHHQRNMARRLNLIREQSDELTKIGKEFLELYERGEDCKDIFGECLADDPYFNTMIKTITVKDSDEGDDDDDIPGDDDDDIPPSDDDDDDSDDRGLDASKVDKLSEELLDVWRSKG